MKTLKLLVLTDHRTHRSSNSFYRLVAGFYEDPRLSSVWLCTRGDSANNDFFNSCTTRLTAIKMHGHFDYSDLHEAWDARGMHVDLNDFDAVVLRIPRPVDDSFFSFLEESFHDPEMIVNRPKAILEVSSKRFLMEVDQFTPPVRIVNTLDDIIGAYEDMGAVVLKPFLEYGGKGVVKYDGTRISTGSKLRSLDGWFAETSEAGEFPMLAMKFLKRVYEGDKRIIVANGHFIGASLRKPAEGSWLCNVAQGGEASISELTEEERQMTDDLSGILTEKGIILFGFDTLVNDDGKRVLSEINVLSPGGIWPAEQQTGEPLTKMTANHIIDYLMGKWNDKSTAH